MTLFHKLGMLLLALVLSLVEGQAQEADPIARPAKVWMVAASDQVFSRTYPALVKPSQEAALSFRVSGRVIELPIRASMDVAKGDVIARLDTRDFERQIAQLESQRDQSLAQLKALRSGARGEEIAALEAGVDAVKAQVDQALEQVERSRELAERGVVAAAKLDQDEAALRVAQAELRAKLEELSIARSGGREEDVQAAEAALRGLETQIQTARDSLEDATLTAPFSGIISRREIENFTNIQAGQNIALLQRLSTVHLVFDVPGPDVIVFSGADDVIPKVIFDAMPEQSFDADLVEFTTQADSTTQTYRGRIAVQLPEESRILPGMVGRVIASVAVEAEDSYEIPLSAVAAGADGAPFVWVVDPGANTVARRPVDLGALSGEMVVVTNGLEAGEMVVSAGITQLQDGMAIRPVTKIGG